jgi:hypothetical protein
MIVELNHEFYLKYPSLYHCCISMEEELNPLELPNEINIVRKLNIFEEDVRAVGFVYPFVLKQNPNGFKHKIIGYIMADSQSFGCDDWVRKPIRDDAIDSFALQDDIDKLRAEIFVDGFDDPDMPF